MDRFMSHQYDVVVIGSGPGGYIAAIRCAQLGLKTACVEKDKTLGGTCVNVGCIPSKALLTSTEYYEWIQKESGKHGVNVSGSSVDFDRMMARKNEVVNGLTGGIASLFKGHKIAWIEGNARFTSPNLLQVGDQVVEGENFIIATGSQSIPLPFLPFDEKFVLSSTGALALSKIPKRLLVVGAGVIGVEIASVYRRLGTEVVLVEMLDRICPTMDGAISKALLNILKKQGLEFHLQTKVTAGKVVNEGVTLTIEENGQTSELQGDHVLVAVGRRPYTEGLGLKEMGVALDKKGFVQINNQFQTSLPHIYAIGDVIEGPMLAHKASEEGVVAAEIIAGHHPSINYLTIPNVIYTHPEVAAVGMTEGEAREAGLDLLLGTCALRALGRARCMGDTEGLIKIIGEKQTGRLIGMHIIAPHASDLIGEGVLALSAKMTVEELANAPHAHPALGEGIKEAALNALGRQLAF